MHLASFIALFINFILAFPGPSISGFHTGFFSWGGGTPRASASKIFGLATPTFTETTPTFTETTPTLTVLWLVKPVSKVDTLLAMYRYSDLAKSADVLHQVTHAYVTTIPHICN